MSPRRSPPPVRLRANVKRIAREAMELPGLRLVGRPLYRRWFQRPYRHGNLYHGIYPDREAAVADAHALSGSLPHHYDIEAAGRLYRSQLHHLRVCDYPVLYWLDRLLQRGALSVYDLGGHIGLAYYSMQRYLSFPSPLRWTVHDVPLVMAQGREWALAHDKHGGLRFSDDPHQASGCDLLHCSGTLQYLDYTLPTLLVRLAQPPAHVILNLTPLHEQQEFFTLQNLGIAICPYRIASMPALVTAMASLGYRIIDQWSIPERSLRVPFALPFYDVERYYGICFQRGLVPVEG